MIIKKSIGAILVKQNRDLVIDYFDFPKKLLRGQVLVRIKFTGVCGSQIGEIKGVKGRDPYLPHLLGHEGLGVVIDKHNTVKKVKNGDRITYKNKNPNFSRNSAVSSSSRLARLRNNTIMTAKDRKCENGEPCRRHKSYIENIIQAKMDKFH